MGGPGSGPKAIFDRRIRIYMNEEQLQELNREAALTGVTKSEIIRQSLRDHFAARAKAAS